MSRIQFEHEIIELIQDLEAIWTSVIGQYNVLLSSPTTKQLQEVVENDLIINEAIMKLDEKCQKVICLQQPVASDLRRIVTVMKLSTDLERMGDRLVNIARFLQDALDRQDWEEVVSEMLVLHLAVRDQIKKALVYYQHLQIGDMEFEFEIDPRRAELTNYLVYLEKKVIELLSKETENVKIGIDSLYILQNVEKISSLVSSVYKWMSYQKTGKIV